MYANILILGECSRNKFKGILTISMYDIYQKILTKKVISKILVDSNFRFSSYA